MSLVRSNLAVASGTAASRVTGLLRVAVLGAVLGQSALTDAYNQANNTPNVVYELLVGGILSAGLVPLFTKLHDRGDEEGTAQIFSVTTIFLAGLTVVSVLAAPWIFRLYSFITADDVDRGVYHAVGTQLSRLFLIQIFFYGVNALAASYLNARGRYFAAAWTPAASNVVIVASLWLVPRTVDGKVPVLTEVLTNDSLRWTLGLGATLGVAVMAIGLLPSLRAVGAPIRPTLNLRSDAVREMRTLSGWALGYVLANQLASVVVQNLTKPGGGAQDAYTRAYTFFVLPHGLLAVSIFTTFLPEMSRAVAQRDKQRFMDRTSLAIRLVALLTIPAGFGLFALRRSAIAATFQYGHFTVANTLLTSRALAGFALGLGGFSLYLTVLRGFYAHGDARTPFIINVFENLINIVVALVLFQRYGVLGLGAGFAIAYTAAAAFALVVLRNKVRGFPIGEVLACIGRVVLASVVMAELAWILNDAIGGHEGTRAVVGVVVASVVGVVAYVLLLTVLGAPEITELLARLPGRKAPPRPLH